MHEKHVLGLKWYLKFKGWCGTQVKPNKNWVGRHTAVKLPLKLPFKNLSLFRAPEESPSLSLSTELSLRKACINTWYMPRGDPKAELIGTQVSQGWGWGSQDTGLHCTASPGQWELISVESQS